MFSSCLIVLCQQVAEIGSPQTLDQFLLRGAPDGLDRAVLIERAGALAADTFIQLDRSVDRFDHLEQRDVLGITRKRNTAARTAGGMKQTGDG